MHLFLRKQSYLLEEMLTNSSILSCIKINNLYANTNLSTCACAYTQLATKYTHQHSFRTEKNMLGKQRLFAIQTMMSNGISAPLLYIYTALFYLYI